MYTLASTLNETWLNEYIWPLEAHLNGEYCYAGALLGCVEMIKSGTTTLNDMYFYMDHVAEAVKETGLRAVISHGMIDFDDEHRSIVPALCSGEDF